MEKQLDRLKEWIEVNSINVERFEYTEPVRTINEAIEISGFSKDKLIKSILLKHKDRQYFILAIIVAGSRVDKKLIDEEVKPKRWTFASIEEIEEITGYEKGGIPPVCIKNHDILSIFVDPRVLKRDFVVGGGGTEKSLIKLDPQLIVDDGAVIKIISFG